MLISSTPRDPESDLWHEITHHARDLWPQTGSTGDEKSLIKLL